ncbi:hypothetical protein CFIO01_13074 [Colletotrichum fioriniae PJ7]|uniref:Uncharacterized protein n=1 Tax=Colletotrichum fioriniae PJ7 TaxID=1445577 RepID=A0A010S341_9PEZI|nr:hypothetical protein CFIO01_13074 [Colletotrichum fioriniae PJ7]
MEGLASLSSPSKPGRALFKSLRPQQSCLVGSGAPTAVFVILGRPFDTLSSFHFPQPNHVMVNFWAIVAFGIWSIIAASPIISDAANLVAMRSDSSSVGKCSSGCGKRNFVFTGLPWDHPAVAASGFTPEQVEAGIRADMAAIVKAGYNIKAILLGPEDSLDFLSDELKGMEWTGTGVGFGVRGNPTPVFTRRLMGSLIPW